MGTAAGEVGLREARGGANGHSTSNWCSTAGCIIIGLGTGLFVEGSGKREWSGKGGGGPGELFLKGSS